MQLEESNREGSRRSGGGRPYYTLLLFTMNPSVKALAMGFHALFPTTIVASIVMIVVSKLTKTPPQETIDRHFAT